jgi:hypothetical protein
MVVCQIPEARDARARCLLTIVLLFAVDTGITVRRISSVQLIATANPPHLLVVDDSIVDRKSEVARNAEDPKTSPIPSF